MIEREVVSAAYPTQRNRHIKGKRIQTIIFKLRFDMLSLLSVMYLDGDMMVLWEFAYGYGMVLPVYHILWYVFKHLSRGGYVMKMIGVYVINGT